MNGLTPSEFGEAAEQIANAGIARYENLLAGLDPDNTKLIAEVYNHLTITVPDGKYTWQQYLHKIFDLTFQGGVNAVIDVLTAAHQWTEMKHGEQASEELLVAIREMVAHMAEQRAQGDEEQDGDQD